MIAEVAASSAAIDLNDKKRAYRRNGVREYLVWQIFENRLDWFYLENGEYVNLTPDTNGVIRSRVFPGLWLAIEPFLAGEMVWVLETLQAGTQSLEHGAFVQTLQSR